ncbi:MAG: hypothetical protein WCT05_09855 [Lentisphaeria bacterium]
MKVWFPISLVALAGAVLVSCKSYPPETQELLSQLSLQESQILRQQAELNNAKIETTYFQEKNEVLNHEKNANQETLVAVCSSVRNVFLDMEQTLQKKSGELYDCFIGNSPVQRQKILENNESLLLVDLHNPATTDMMLMEAQLYCHSPATVNFCLLRQVPDSLNTYEIVAISEELTAPEPGKQLLRFSGRSALLAKKGDFVGVLLAPGTQLSYDDAGTGMTPSVAMSALQRKTKLQLPAEDLRKGRAFSWQLWGFRR